MGEVLALGEALDGASFTEREPLLRQQLDVPAAGAEVKRRVLLASPPRTGRPVDSTVVLIAE